MNDTKQLYEAPATEVFVVRMESGLLEGSIKAGRSSYDTAEEETWG